MKQLFLKPLVSDAMWPAYVRWSRLRTPEHPDRLFRRALYERMRRQQPFIESFLREVAPDCAVMHGPFAGLQYPALKAVGSTLAPKLLGTYEAEVQSFFNTSSENDYEQVIDVGCAEGYYAIGSARMFPHAMVRAYDISPEAQRLCEGLAELNEVSDRVTVEGRCQIDDLRSLQDRRSLVISDCEGGEMALFTASLIEQLPRTDFVIEVHENLGADRDELIRRFDTTHHCEPIPSLTDLQRLVTYHPEAIEHLPDAQRIVLLAECRSPYNSWLVATPRQTSSSKVPT